MLYPKILELPDTKLTLRQIEHQADGTLYLHLKGFSFHSSLAVDNVSVSGHDGHPLVLIRLTPVRKGKDGNFDVRVRMTSENDEVLFGEQAQKIWPAGG